MKYIRELPDILGEPLIVRRRFGNTIDGYQWRISPSYRLSVIFGWGTYCGDGYFGEIGVGGLESTVDEDYYLNIRTNAEIAIINNDNELVEIDNDTVMGYQTVDDILAIVEEWRGKDKANDE